MENKSKENFRRSYNAQFAECQEYEAEKQRKNQELVNSLQNMFIKYAHLLENGSKINERGSK